MPSSSNRPQRSRHDAGHRPNEAFAALAALALLALLIGGGLVLFARRGNGPQVDLLVGADITGSVHKGDRQKLFGVLDETVSEVLPKGTPVEMWSFDVNAHKFTDVTPTRPEDLWPDEDAIIGQQSKTFGTYPAVALKEMASAVTQAQTKGRGAAIMMLTDGEDQDPKNTVAVITQLAGMPGLKAVWFCGTTANNGFRSEIERRMTPILGDRLIVTSSNDALDGLNKLHRLIERK
jgi:hypothetical protein